MRCYRALASPHPTHQAWGNFDSIRSDGNPCLYFWDTTLDDDLQDNGFPLVTPKEDE